MEKQATQNEPPVKEEEGGKIGLEPAPALKLQGIAP